MQNPYYNATDAAADNLATRHMATGRPVYAVRLQSEWSGVGAVDRQIAAYADAAAAHKHAAAEPSVDGEYGRVVARVVEHAPSAALVTLAGKGATIDTSLSPRLWIGDACVACTAAEVSHYRSARALTGDEIEYIMAAGSLARE